MCSEVGGVAVDVVGRLGGGYAVVSSSTEEVFSFVQSPCDRNM